MKPWSILWRILGIIMLVELCVMVIFGWLRIPQGVGENIADALLLALGSAPLLYVWVVKVVAKQVTTRTVTAQEEIRRAVVTSLDQTSDTVLISDCNGIIEDVNPAFEQVTGYSREEVLGKTPRILKSDQHSRVFYESFWQTLLLGRAFQATFINRKKNGELYYLEQTVTPLTDPEGRVTRFVSTGRDVTQRLQMEEALRKSEARYHELLNTVNDGFFVADTEGRLLFANSALAKIHRLRGPEELIGRRFLDFIAPADLEEVERIYRDMMHGKPFPDVVTTHLSTPSGEEVVVEVKPSLFIEHGKVVQSHGVVRDITDRQQVQQFKDEFLYIIPHELRTPLTSIEQGIELLQDGSLGPLTPSAQSVVDTMAHDLGRLDKIIKKIELVERIMLRRHDYSFEPCDLAQVVNQLEATYRPKAESGQQGFLVEGSVRAAPCVGDAKQLELALRELIDNALKVTPDGGTVTLRWSAVGGGWQFDVEDAGPGIPERELSTLFERFRSIGGLGDRKTGGLGVGLFIAKSVIAAHGGSIAADSTVGRGTRVTVWIPQSAKRKIT